MENQTFAQFVIDKNTTTEFGHQRFYQFMEEKDMEEPRVHFTLPNDLMAWFMVCTTAELKRGHILSRQLAGKEIIVYRGGSRQVFAVSAHCPHMGTHLKNGTVIDDAIRCPLHHWVFDGAGFCQHSTRPDGSSHCERLKTFPVAEAFGAIYVFNGEKALFPPPKFSLVGPEKLRIKPGSPVELSCSWHAPTANGFDMQHFQTVHGRALRKPPVVDQISSYILRLRYTSKVTGKKLSDRIMKWLSRNKIQAVITSWGGSVVTVEIYTGRTRSFLLLNFLPTSTGVRITPIYGMVKSRFFVYDRFRLMITAWLFNAFLKRDVSILKDMEFRPCLARSEDPILFEYFNFLHQFPVG